MCVTASGRWTRRTAFLGLLALAPAAAAPTAPEGQVLKAPTLKAGDPAPALRASRWFKGEPVAAFRKGHIYVLEFWATWCSPCRASIPHVTGIAKAFEGKVTVIGVNVWEGSASSDHSEAKEVVRDTWVKNFVDTLGPKMGYSVCRDTRDGQMARTWLEAAGLHGIPATIVVDREGRIAWVGHPMELEKVLKAMVDGTFRIDQAPAPAPEGGPQAEEERSQKEFAAIISTWSTQEPLLAAAKDARDWNRLLQLTEACERDFPKLKPLVLAYRLRALVETSPEKAFEYMDAYVNKGTFKEYFNASSVISADPTLGPRWTAKALDYIDKAAATPEGQTDEIRGRRFTLLLRLEPDKAKQQLDEMQTQASEPNAPLLAHLAQVIIQEAKLDRSWYERAISILEPQIRLPNDRIMLGYDLAVGYLKAGQTRKADAAYQSFLAALQAHGTDPSAIEESRKAFEALKQTRP